MIAESCAVWEVAKFVLTKSNNTLLLDKEGGYVFKVSSRHNGKTYWACRNKSLKQDKCMARAITDGNYVTYWKGGHNHDTNVVSSDVMLENFDYFGHLPLPLPKGEGNASEGGSSFGSFQNLNN